MYQIHRVIIFLNIQIVKIKKVEWNPEKDLLAMVTEDSKISLHRFNWQSLWTISPGILYDECERYRSCAKRLV
ncbi:putative anaphase-promoting complex subunit 4 [Helianthus anomalus]